MASSRRDHLVDIALEMFCRDGFRATGIDRILAVAGVAKMTLYNHFRSKDELILAALRRRDERFRNWFMRTVESRAATPDRRLLALFDVLGEWFVEADFNGCAFICAAVERKRPGDPVHDTAVEHKRLMSDYVRGLAADAGADDPAALARSLMLLVEGAIVTVQVSGRTAAAADARAAAAVLLRDALGAPSPAPRSGRRTVPYSPPMTGATGERA